MSGAEPRSLDADAAAPAVGSRTLALDFGQIGVGVGAAIAVGALGAANGGYFPPAWGWTALLALWLVIAWLLLGRAAFNGGRPAAVFVGGLTAFAAWTWLSLLWTDNTTQTVLEGFRMLAYAGIAAAFVFVVRRAAVAALLRGVLAAIVIVGGYGLATRLFPDRLGSFDPVSTYRLSEPLGYWNGLGVFAAMGVLLALGLAARERNLVARALAGASSVVLVTTLYFTFSRGAWIALAVGVAAAVALDVRRLQLIVSLLVVGIPGLLAALVASRSDALTTEDSPLSAAVDEGREVAIIVAILALVAAAAVLAQVAAERRFHPSRPVRLAFGGAVAAVTAVVLIAAVVRLGGPIDAADRAYDSFTAEPTQQSEDLRERLFVFNANYRIDLWEASWEQFQANPILGGGAGTYEQYWNQHRDLDHKVRDGHSLYLETLGELGLVGFAILLIVLAVPLAAAVGARRHPLAAAAFGAYVAYLVHAGVDWDWELAALTVVALACAAALIVLRSVPGSDLVPGVRFRIAAGAAAAVMAGAAFVGLVGSSALSASDHAAVATPPDWDEAADEARKAEDWAPWSSEPWQRLGDAQAGQGDLAAAQESYRSAIDKEPGDWLLWLRLAEASSGAERQAALRQAARLNPLEDEVRQVQEGGR